MDRNKKKRLEKAGWTVGSASDFLELADAETGLVEIRISLAQSIRARRNAAELTQAEVAKLAGTTQARIAKAENANPEISLDLCLRVLLALGASHKKIAKAIAA